MHYQSKRPMGLVESRPARPEESGDLLGRPAAGPAERVGYALAAGRLVRKPVRPAK